MGVRAYKNSNLPEDRPILSILLHKFVIIMKQGNKYTLSMTANFAVALVLHSPNRLPHSPRRGF